MSTLNEQGYSNVNRGSGLSDNIAGGLCYITFIPAVIFLLVEPYNRRPFVRFNAYQCLVLQVVSFLVGLLHFIPVIGILSFLLSFVLFILTIVACIAAFMGKKFAVPVVGTYAQQFADNRAVL